jgi:hypothetical protein
MGNSAQISEPVSNIDEPYILYHIFELNQDFLAQKSTYLNFLGRRESVKAIEDSSAPTYFIMFLTWDIRAIILLKAETPLHYDKDKKTV